MKIFTENFGNEKKYRTAGLQPVKHLKETFDSLLKETSELRKQIKGQKELVEYLKETKNQLEKENRELYVQNSLLENSMDRLENNYKPIFDFRTHGSAKIISLFEFSNKKINIPVIKKQQNAKV